MANAGFPYNPFIMSSIRCVAASQKAGSRGCQVAANARLRASQVWTSQTRWTGQVQPARWESSWFVSWTGNQGNQGNQGIQGIQENQGNQKNQGNPGNQGKGSKGTQQTREPRREPREPSWRDGHFFRVNDHEWIISPPAIWRSNWWPTGRTPGVGKKTTSWETSTDLWRKMFTNNKHRLLYKVMCFKCSSFTRISSLSGEVHIMFRQKWDVRIASWRCTGLEIISTNTWKAGRPQISVFLSV